MGKKSSKVMTPRNVDLPLHVINTSTMAAANGSIVHAKKPRQGSRKKCLCLTSWLAGLVFLCIGVFVVANFLMSANSDDANNVICLERNGISLEQKATLSDLIVVGRVETDFDTYGGREERADPGASAINVARVNVYKTLKSKYEEEPPKSLKFSQREQDSPCRISVEDARQEKIFFLSKYDDDTNEANFEAVRSKWTPRFRALEASSKLTQVIESLIDQDEQTKGKKGKNRP